MAEGDDAGGAHARALLETLDEHVRKEELGLYPWLSETGDLAADVLGRLEAEHVEVRSESVDGRFDRRSFYALAAHLAEAEMELFPAAMFAFDDDAWDDLEGLIAPAA